MKNIVIVGGGSAGWITALMVREYYLNYKITVIQSSEIGILGAGEGTTPHFTSFLEEVKISLQEVINAADATIKLGIRFENWNGDGKNYFHGFKIRSELDQINNFTVLCSQIKKNYHIDDIDFASKCADQKKTTFYYNPKHPINSPADLLDRYSEYGLHFNAVKLAKFLQAKGQERNIQVIDAKVTEIKNDQAGYVRTLHLDNGTVVDADFVFDCSGFARLIIGKHYNTEWESYADYLPMNTAIPFFIPHNNDTKPETRSIAMKAGWIWQIPVRDRYGCGYVFDNNYINADEALAEAEQLFQQKLTVPKVFKFAAGGYKKTLVKNVCAIGLSQGFVEPLEATSIYASLLNLKELLDVNGVNLRSPLFEKKYNEKCVHRNHSIRDFIYFHYLTRRSDSDFWREFRTKNHRLENCYEDIELISQSPTMTFNNNAMFTNFSYLQVGLGLKLIDIKNYMMTFGHIDQTFADNLRTQCVARQKYYLQTCLSHSDLLNLMMF